MISANLSTGSQKSQKFDVEICTGMVRYETFDRACLARFSGPGLGILSVKIIFGYNEYKNTRIQDLYYEFSAHIGATKPWYNI